MSYTEIYHIGEDECILIGETKNAHLGAMYVWNFIAQKYFKLEYFPYFDSDFDLQMRIWNAENEHDLDKEEKIVLRSTLDRMCVRYNEVPELIEAYELFGKKHPKSSFTEQCQIIRDAYEEMNPKHLLSWNQTSVCEFCFAPDKEYGCECDNEEDCECENGYMCEYEEPIVTYKSLDSANYVFE